MQLMPVYMIRTVPLLRLSNAHYAQARPTSYALYQSSKLIFLLCQLNRYCMGILFFIPLTLIAFYESTFDRRKHVWMENWFRGDDEASQDCPENRNPEVNDPNCEGLKISNVPFDELIKAFPKIDQVALLFVFNSSASLIKKIFTYSRVKKVF